jgi:hypothetical protein
MPGNISVLLALRVPFLLTQAWMVDVRTKKVPDGEILAFSRYNLGHPSGLKAPYHPT